MNFYRIPSIAKSKKVCILHYFKITGIKWDKGRMELLGQDIYDIQAWRDKIAGTVVVKEALIILDLGLSCCLETLQDS